MVFALIGNGLLTDDEGGKRHWYRQCREMRTELLHGVG